jgi:hypothetical protein
MPEVITDPNEPNLDAVIDPVKEQALELEPVVEPVAVPETPPVHPLSPGGVRFDQVYARGKQAERDLATEREKRIAAEAKLEALSTRPTTPEASGNEEYSWAQLNEFIAAGRITLADAQAHREGVLRKQLLKEAKAELKHDVSVTDRLNNLNRGFYEYVAAIPSLTNPTSPERLRVEEEFNWLVDAQGVDLRTLKEVDRKGLELTALRTVYGSVDALKKRSTPVPARETHQGISGGIPPERKPNPDQDLLNKLDNRQREYYRSKIGTIYKTWADVVEELKFDASKMKK